MSGTLEPGIITSLTFGDTAAAEGVPQGAPEAVPAPAGDDAILAATEAFAEPFEGFSARPYQDPGGVWTIGYGSIWDYRNSPPTRVTGDTPPVDQGMARLFVVDELRETLKQLRAVVDVPLTADETTALLDFSFNVGVGNLKRSSLLRCLNAGDLAGAASHFEDWSYAAGKKLAGLLRRRLAERDLFLSEQGVP